VRVRHGHVNGIGSGGCEFRARNGPGAGIKFASYGGGCSLLSKCGISEVMLLS
jgi:hypothetical protein